MEHKIIAKCLVGSQAHGTATPESDLDYKGVYKQPIDDLISYGYQEFNKISKDEIHYEIKRFFDLLIAGNPESLELLFTPEDCIIIDSPEFKLLRENKHIFLTKKCAKSFANYGYSQIHKAKGLDKMMNWEKDRVERKTPLDFCYVHSNGKTLPIHKFFEIKNMKQEYCGVSKLNHADDAYVFYYDPSGTEKFKGIIGEDSNELRLSSVSKEFADTNEPYVMFFSKNSYSTHCKDYKNYQTWLKERNVNRYHTNKSHGQLYDSKNLSHCRRLIDIAIEIANTCDFSVRRPNADYLMQIKRGDLPLDEILSDAQKDIVGLQEIYDNSSLPEEVNIDVAKELLLKIRHM